MASSDSVGVAFTMEARHDEKASFEYSMEPSEAFKTSEGRGSIAMNEKRGMVAGCVWDPVFSAVDDRIGKSEVMTLGLVANTTA